MELGGKLLIAMPGMSDPRFEKSVVFLCMHSADGAMGLIVNKPAKGLDFATLLQQLKIHSAKRSGETDPPRAVAAGSAMPDSPRRDIVVHTGGPVELGRGFVLHGSDYQTDGSTLQINDAFALTGTVDVLENIARGGGPVSVLLALGYAGWGPGQLEREIGANGWLTCDASAELVFAPEDGRKWERALKTLGVDALALSAAAGRA